MSYKSSAVVACQVASWSNQLVGHNIYGPKIGRGSVPLWRGGAESPSNTVWPRPTSMPCFVLIHSTVWPQYTKVTDRQRTDSIGRTVLQTVAQKSWKCKTVSSQRVTLTAHISGESGSVFSTTGDTGRENKQTKARSAFTAMDKW